MASRAALETNVKGRAAAAGRARRPLAAAPFAVSEVLLQRMASVVLGSGVGVVRGHRDRGPRWANEAFVTMSGQDAGLAELTWSAIIPGGVLPPMAPAGGIAPTVECEFVRRDGSAWPVIVSRGVDPVDPAQVILFVVDLTASRLADAARRAAEGRYARFFEVSNVAFWTADAQGRARLTSRTIAERLGTDVELDSLASQAELIHPDDRALAEATWQEAIAGGTAYELEIRARGLDGGDHRWTRLRAFPDHQDGTVVGWYGITEDIHERRLAADLLAESEQRFKRLADEIPAMVWLTDATERTTYLSRAWYSYTGQTEAEAVGFGWLDAILPEDRDALAEARGVIKRREKFDVDFRLRAADGTWRWMLSSGRPRLDASGTLLGYAGTVTDIHARKTAESELAELQLRLSRALDGTGVGVWEWDAATDKVTVSGSALGISGFTSQNETYQQVDYRAALHPADRDHLLSAMAAYVEGRSDDFTAEVRIRRRDGGWVWVLDRGTATARDADGRALRMVGTLTNIDESKRAEERLRWTVDHDALTGLSSRTLFHARLDAALATAGPVALALLDIDDFKGVNDRLGHAAGDAVLTMLAARLTAFTGPGETVARLGGDEFTLILPQCGDEAVLAARLEALRCQLLVPFVHEGKSLTCRSSIGVAIAPAHGRDATTLLKNADIAMYSVKAARGSAVAMYEPALGAKVRSASAAAEAVREAINEDRVVPLYEPVVRLVDRKVICYESLAHIVGADGSLVDAHSLEAAFDDIELTSRFGDHLVDKVLADFAGWRDQGVAPGFVAINVSPAELSYGDYAERLFRRIAAHGIAPAQVRVEIADIGVDGLRAGTAAAAVLETLARGGILIGLDNFGVGAASLSLLSELPLAAVKIDRELIKGIALPGKHRSIVRAITGLGRNFGLRVISCGVETAAQIDALIEIGATSAQGPYFGPPTDATATLAQLRSSRPFS